MASVLKKLNFIPNMPVVTYQTNTILDIAMGTFVNNSEKEWFLRGGLSTALAGFIGKGETYKTTLALSLMLRAMSIYPESEAIIMDSENSLSMERLAAINHNPVHDPIDRVKLINNTNYDVTDYFALLKEIIKDREKNPQDYMVDAPWIDINTGKKARIWIPLFLCIDTLTEFQSRVCLEMLEKGDIDDGKLKTIFLADGQQKTILLTYLNRWAAKYGLVVILPAHTGSNQNIGSMMPPAKQLQYMKQDEKIKRVGAGYDRLTRILLRTQARCLQDGNKQAYYQNGPTGDKDSNEVFAQILRNKEGGGSGSIVPFIISQTKGLLNDVTYYHYLKQNKNFGLLGANKHKSPLVPDTTLSRNTARDAFDKSYELRRAFEITGQICWMLHNWNTPIAQSLNGSIENLLEKLMNNKSIKVNDILNSRGYWTYDKKDRPYMTTIDVLNLLAKK